MYNTRDVADIVRLLLNRRCRGVVKYLSPTEVARVTHAYYRGSKAQWKDFGRGPELFVHLGKPNYRERQHVKHVKSFPHIEYREFPQ